MKKEYTSTITTNAGSAAITEIREAYSALHELLEKHATPSRERSVALTDLEKSSHFAIRAVALAYEEK
jgi:hypothetical protein